MLQILLCWKRDLIFLPPLADLHPLVFKLIGIFQPSAPPPVLYPEPEQHSSTMNMKLARRAYYTSELLVLLLPTSS